MYRAEALTLLHEIQDACKEITTIHSISLDEENSAVSVNSRDSGYLIRMKVELDNYAKECINPILEKHNSAMREEEGYVIIFKKHSIN